MQVDRRLFGWGLFFILLGGIPLATKAGLLNEQLLRQWPYLWPVLLIGWGLGLLLRGTSFAIIGGAVTAVTFGVMGGSALAAGFGDVPFASGCGGSEPTKAFETRNGEFGTSASTDFVFNCGTFNVATADGSAWSVAGSDRDGAGPEVVSNQGSLSVEALGDQAPFGGTGRSTWDVVLPRSPILALGLTLNAGEADLDLSGASISTVSMTVNAGAMTLDLGETADTGDVNGTVNFGSAAISMPGGERDVNLSFNTGSLKVCLPTGVPVRVEWRGAAGSNNFDEVGLVELDDDTWTTVGFVDGQPHVELQVSANAGSFELQFGGTCEA